MDLWVVSGLGGCFLPGDAAYGNKNNQGQVVGGSGKAYGGFYHAFSWTQGAGMQDPNLLAPPPTPDKGWDAVAVNNSGQIAGNDAWEEYAFLLAPVPPSITSPFSLLLLD